MPDYVIRRYYGNGTTEDETYLDDECYEIVNTVCEEAAGALADSTSVTAVEIFEVIKTFKPVFLFRRVKEEVDKQQ